MSEHPCQKKFKNDSFWDLLCQDVIQQIFTFLDFRDILRIQSINKIVLKCSKDNWIWSEIAKRHKDRLEFSVIGYEQVKRELRDILCSTTGCSKFMVLKCELCEDRNCKDCLTLNKLFTCSNCQVDVCCKCDGFSECIACKNVSCVNCIIYCDTCSEDFCYDCFGDIENNTCADCI